MPRSLPLKPLLLTLALSGAPAAGLLLGANVAMAQSQERPIGSVQFVRADKLNLRSSPSTSVENVVGSLVRNDEVQILSRIQNSGGFVEVEVKKAREVAAGTKGFVAENFLGPKSTETSTPTTGASKYFIIQNVATEVTRVYERCTTSPGCPHKMVMESEMVVGRAEGPRDQRDRFLTRLGRYKITSWKKFYEDQAGNYPSWYHPDYPEVPYNTRDPQMWFSKSMMPKKGGHMRGAFGWYTAFVGPNADSQWLHGTIGWGIEGDRYIKYTRGFWTNVVANPRSSGCTRLENQAVAYIRELAPVGTEVLRVYALEGTRAGRVAVQQATAPWEWILTKEGVQQDGPLSNKASVLRRNVPASMYLEQGTYTVDLQPDAMGVTPRNPSRTGKSGNTYEIPEKEFRGVYLVEEGRLIGYAHPGSMLLGGFQEKQLPADYQTEGAFVLAPRGPDRFTNDHQASGGN